MNIILKFLSFLSVFQIVKATITLRRIDSDIDAGPVSDDASLYGHNFAMSLDGNVIVVGQFHGLEAFNRVYRKDDYDSWTNDGDIKQSNVRERFAGSASISDDGNKFVIAITGYEVDSEGKKVTYLYFKVYEYNYLNKSWNYHSSIVPEHDFLDQSDGSLTIYDVAMSGNGDRIVIAVGLSTKSFVSIYSYNGEEKTWIREGGKFVDGFDAAISSNGDEVAIANPYSKDVIIVKVGDSDNSWEYDRSITGFAGSSPANVEMSGKSETIGIGVVGGESNQISNYVCNGYETSHIDDCTKLSEDGKFLIGIGISNDGNIVAVERKNDVVLHNYENGKWKEIGGSILANTEEKMYNHPILSGDGSILAVQANIYDKDKNYVKTNIELYELTCPKTTGDCGGDPHFTSFSGKSFDFHGECDLILFSSLKFSSGSGISVHVRTTRMDGRLMSYSYISAVAVRIGKNVLEVQQDGTLIVNGKRFASSQDDVFPTKFGDYVLIKNMKGKKKKITQYILDLSNTLIDSDGGTRVTDNPMKITIHANSRTNMIHVKIDGDFEDSEGLLGKANAGDSLLGRDGVSDFSHDLNQFGEEWQVMDTEPTLFVDHRAPQFPDPCVYYSSDGVQMMKTHHLRRRLLADGSDMVGLVTMEDAEAACADYVGVKKEHCVQDVMVIQDLEVANDPSYCI